MNDFTGAGMHCFPLRDVQSAKAISHSYGTKLAMKLVPDTGCETALTLRVSVLQYVHLVSVHQ